MNSEELKTLIDTFGRMSFVLETVAKLAQTNDHNHLRDAAIAALEIDASTFVHQVNALANKTIHSDGQHE